MNYILKEANSKENKMMLFDADKFGQSYRFPGFFERIKYNIAINLNNGNYLYLAPNLPDTVDILAKIFFYFRDYLYELHTRLSEDYLYLTNPNIKPESLNEFKQELRDAFSVFNRHGFPLENDMGVNRINPELDPEIV